MGLIGFVGESRAAARVADLVSERLVGWERAAGWEDGRAAITAWVDSGTGPVSGANHTDGSFLLVDGRVYAVDATVPQDRRPHAAQVLDRFRRQGAPAFGATDSAAVIVGFDASLQAGALWRDHYGQVPVYYCDYAGGTLWCSDVETVLRLGFPLRVNLHALDFCVAEGYVPAPWSLVMGIRKLSPGHLLELRFGDTPRLVEHGMPCLEVEVPSDDEEVVVLRRLLERSIARRWDPAAPAAVLLSGGVDSALLAATARLAFDLPLDAFTFQYSDYEGPFNEGLAAARVATHLGMPHHLITVRPESFWNDLERAVGDYQGPVTWGVHTYQLDDIAAHGIETVFSGMLPFWTLYKRDRLARQLARWPRSITTIGRWVAGSLARVWPTHSLRLQRLLRRPASLGAQFHWGDVTPAAVRRHLYLDPNLFTESETAAHELLDATVALLPPGPEDRRLIALYNRYVGAEHFLYWNHAWTKNRRLTIHFPYHDLAFNAVVTKLGERLVGKAHLRRMAATMLPPDMAHAPARPHTMPFGHWLRGPLSDRVRSHLDKASLDAHGVFDHVEVAKLLDAHGSGRIDHSETLLAVLTTTIWLDRLNAVGAGT